MMKKFAIIVLLLVFLAACGQELPPNPPPPGGDVSAGRAFAGMAAGMPSWAAPAKNIAVNPSQAYFNDGVIISVSSFDYIYSNGYLFNSQTRTWEKFALQGEQVESWIKSSAIGSITIDKSKFSEGDNYAVVYACSKTGGQWDCNGKRWMLVNFKVLGLSTSKIPEMANVNQLLINTAIGPFAVTSADAMKDNFADINVITYTANYRESKIGLAVMVHVSDFNSRQDLDQTINTIFKDKVQNGFKTYNGQNIAMFLSADNNHRIAFWTSGRVLVYIETYDPEAGNKEVIEGYLAKYPSDMKKLT